MYFEHNSMKIKRKFIFPKLSSKQHQLDFMLPNKSLKIYLQILWPNLIHKQQKTGWSISHHMSLELFFALHEIETKLTKIKLGGVVVLWWKGGEIPCFNLISSKFNCCNIFHFCKFFMLPQAGSIEFLMAL